MGHYECKACGQRYDNCFCGDFAKPPTTRRKNEPSFAERCKGILCLNHRKYRAKSKPRAACEECWRAWIAAEDKRLAEIEKIINEPKVTLYCNSYIPGHHSEECVRKKGHDGYCSSSAMDVGE